jgi:16S rRNA (cytosine1402-N4)-methyltransferase
MYNVTSESHNPVMLKEVIHYMDPKDGEIFVDGTFGAGGYTKGLLKTSKCNVYAIDRDPDVIAFVEKIAEKDRLCFINGNFSDMENLIKYQGVEEVDGIVLDIGVSSMQLDTDARGFSFMREGPLDMRMSKSGRSAKDLINNGDEREIANIIYEFGEEHLSRKIARKIVIEREKEEITTTTKLRDIVHSVYPKKHWKIDPATKTFQAIRIWVNDELTELKKALEAAERLLKKGGRLVIVSFHSLEDQMVKKFFNEKSGNIPGVSRYIPVTNTGHKPVFKLLTKHAVKPSEEEVSNNQRARSARLRAVVKIANNEGVEYA